MLEVFAGVKSSKKEELPGRHKDSQVSNAPIFTMRYSVGLKRYANYDIVDHMRFLRHGSLLATYPVFGLTKPIVPVLGNTHFCLRMPAHTTAYTTAHTTQTMTNVS